MNMKMKAKLQSKEKIKERVKVIVKVKVKRKCIVIMLAGFVRELPAVICFSSLS